MTIAEFWRLRAELLEEVRYKNFLESNIMGDFQLVNHDGEIEAESDGDIIDETDLVIFMTYLPMSLQEYDFSS
jgi:hypothetical protein